ncbi:hypothetical protein Tco_0757305 [Tanacetum coccineum]
MPYPHQRYAVYNTLVNEEESTGFTSIRRIHKKDTAYPCLHFTKTTNETRPNTPYPGDINTPYSQYSNKIFWKISNVVLTPRNPQYVIWYDEDIHDLRSVETEFPTIAINDEVSSDKTLSCEPTISSLNDEIDFRVSFDDSDDEDYTVVFDKNSFSYKKKFANDLKMDSENDNEKVIPSLPSPEPTVSYFDDLDFFKDFENEFPAIVYNDALTSKSDLLTEPILNPQHIDEFNLKDETSLSECDEEEQNILNFNDLFPFNIIYPNDSKSKKDNDDDKVDIEHSSRDLSVKPLPDVSIRRVLGNGYDVSTSCTVLGPRERNIDEYWWKIYKSRDLEVLES